MRQKLLSKKEILFNPIAPNSTKRTNFSKDRFFLSTSLNFRNKQIDDLERNYKSFKRFEDFQGFFEDTSVSDSSLTIPVSVVDLSSSGFLSSSSCIFISSL